MTVNIRADLMDDNVASALSRARCDPARFAIETGNEAMRNSVLQKKLTDEQILTAAKLFKKYNVPFVTYNMMGIPNETLSMAWQTISMNQERYSLLVEITTDSNGNIILKLPRESFDAQKSDGADNTFIVLISKENNKPEDFMQVEYEEIATGSDYRTIRIPLEENDKWVEVIGTYVIPEFGSVVLIILVVAVASTIVISKSRFSVRYN